MGIPRRELYDVRMQVMVSDECGDANDDDDDEIGGLAGHDRELNDSKNREGSRVGKEKSKSVGGDDDEGDDEGDERQLSAAMQRLLLGTDDIKTSVYEGGLKSWECSFDLVDELATHGAVGGASKVGVSADGNGNDGNGGDGNDKDILTAVRKGQPVRFIEVGVEQLSPIYIFL